MRTVIFLLLLIPAMSFAQRQDVYVKLTDSQGSQIKGDAVTRGFERWMQALTVNSGGKNNTQLSFTTTISGASAELKKAIANGEWLMNGQVSVMQVAGGESQKAAYIIKMEKIKVLSCSEMMGCNGVMTTSVTLQATRIGWTYYQTNKMGTQVVSNKYGYDAETGGQWTNF